MEDAKRAAICMMEAGLKKVVPNQVGWDGRSYYVSRIQFISSRVCLYHKNHENKCVLFTQFSPSNFSPGWGYTVFGLKHPPLPPITNFLSSFQATYSIFCAWGLGVLLVFFVERRKLRDASENGTKRAIDIVLA